MSAGAAGLDGERPTTWSSAITPPGLVVRGPRVAVALLALGAFAALVLPGARLGLGAALALLGVAVCAALLRGAGRAGGAVGMGVGVTLRGRRDRAELGFAALGVALAAQAVLRDDATLVVLDACGAGWAAAVALGGARRWRPLASAAFAPFRHLLHGLGLATVTLQGLVPERRGGALGPVVRGAALSCALLAVFGALFVSADGAFAQLAGDALAPDLDGADLLARGLLGLCALTVAASLALGSQAAPAGPSRPGALTRRGLERAEWLMPLLALVVLFAAFVAVQVAVLFGGRRHVLETAGLGYGEYAREGFGQLLLVAALTLAVVAATVRLARRTARDEWLMKALLGALCALTGVVLASALHRLGLVEEAYGSSRARLAGQAVVLWLGAVLVLVLAAGVVRPLARHLPRLVVALSLAGLLAHSLSAPDARIASENVERFARTGQLDRSYLAGLSADAIPALTRLPAAARGCLLARQQARLDQDDGGWAGTNWARARARAALERIPAPACQR